MRVFARFSEDKAGLIRVWLKSWEARGWVPQLISEREIRTHETFRKAVRARGGGYLTDLRIINFSCTPRRRAKRRTAVFGRSGWEAADLVRFPTDSSEQSVRDCGRPL